MSLATNALPTSSADMKAETKSPRIVMTELSSSSVPNSISDNDFRLGDPFLEDFYDSGLPDQRNLMNEPAALKSQIQLLDVYLGGISKGTSKRSMANLVHGSAERKYSCELRDTCFSNLKVEDPENCQIRIMLADQLENYWNIHLTYCRFLKKKNPRIHLRDNNLNDAIRTFSEQYAVPAAFWDQEGVGSVGQRKALSESCGQSNGTWLSTLQKKSEGKTDARRWTAVLLKHHDPVSEHHLPMPKITLICYNASGDLRRCIHHAFNLGRIPSTNIMDGVISDPVRLLLLVAMASYHWNSKLIWTLTTILRGLEEVNGIKGVGLWRSRAAEYAYMHLRAQDMTQTLELLEVSLKLTGRLKKLHERSFEKQVDLHTLEHYEQTAAALDYQFSRFEGLRERVQAILKRMNNQISLTFHLGQQKAAKTAQGSSDSVRTISIPTLLFLPGTGIATIFSTPFFRLSDSSFSLKIAPSFLFYWIWIIPTTVIIMIFWLWWSITLKPSAKDSALHTIMRSPQRKPMITSWREWIMKAKDAGYVDLEQRRDDLIRPHSPHFWDYTPSWPMPEREILRRGLDSEEEEE